MDVNNTPRGRLLGIGELNKLFFDDFKPIPDNEVPPDLKSAGKLAAEIDDLGPFVDDIPKLTTEIEKILQRN